MKVGTKSILFGAHCFFIHPWFVALAWWRLYGFPWDPRLWFAFFLHDLGYWGKSNMDGEEGERHPYWGAKVMSLLFDARGECKHLQVTEITGLEYYEKLTCKVCNKWGNFTLFHSRFLAKKSNAHFSSLCVADKYSFCLTPAWLYLPMVNWTGEIHEYMKLSQKRREAGEPNTVSLESQKIWHKGVSDYLRDWAIEHKDMKIDTWTPDGRVAKDTDGVWK